MYTRDRKTRAVELYIEYGRKAAATIRELGHPCRGQLRAWYKGYGESGGEIPEHGLEKYAPEQRRAAVDHYLGHGRRGAYARRKLGYPGCRKVPAAWMDELAPGQRRTTEPRTFTASEKARAAEALVSRGGSAAEVAGEVGSCRVSPYKWRRELPGEDGARMAGDDAATPRPAVPPEARTAAQADIDAPEARKAELEREIGRLELRRDIMQGAVELLGKGPGADPANELTDRGEALLVDSLRPRWRLRGLLEAPSTPRSSHRYQAAAIAAGDRDAGARPLVCEVFGASDGACGRRRTHDGLAASGHVVGERGITRILAERGLVARGRPKPRRRHGPCAGEVPGHPGNRVGRDLSAGLPSFPWPADVTQLPIPAGKLYLSPVLDCFDGAIVSWTVSTTPTAGTANSMLRAALAKTPADERSHLVVHPDCGCHCRWPEWTSICDGAGVTRSTSRRGCSPDNSRMEGFFGTMKAEMLCGRGWSGATLDELEARIDAYIERHDTRRTRRSPGSMSPLQYRQSLGLAA